MDFASFLAAARSQMRLDTAAVLQPRLRLLTALSEAGVCFDGARLLEELRSGSSEEQWLRAVYGAQRAFRSLAQMQGAVARIQGDMARADKQRAASSVASLSDSVRSHRSKLTAFSSCEAVVGRSVVLDKQFVRPADVPDEAAVRTPATLEQAVARFTDEWPAALAGVVPRREPSDVEPDPPYDPAYMLFRARMKAVIYDYTVQGLVSSPFHMLAYERMVLAAVVANDMPEFAASADLFLGCASSFLTTRAAEGTSKRRVRAATAYLPLVLLCRIALSFAHPGLLPPVTHRSCGYSHFLFVRRHKKHLRRTLNAASDEAYALFKRLCSALIALSGACTAVATDILPMLGRFQSLWQPEDPLACACLGRVALKLRMQVSCLRKQALHALRGPVRRGYSAEEQDMLVAGF